MWFCPTLYKGALPTKSPYGDTQIAIPIASIITDKHKMCYEGAYYFEKDTTKQYFRFFLVKEDQKEEYKWCKENLFKVEITSNRIFSFDSSTGMAKCVENKAAVKLHIWVDIMVVGDVPYFLWKKVGDTGRKTTEPRKELLDFFD